MTSTRAGSRARDDGPRFDSLDPRRGPRSFTFSGRIDEIVAHDPAAVEPALERVARAVDAGRHAAGFVAYEAAPGLDRALSIRGRPSTPLLHFGIYEARTPADPIPPPPLAPPYQLGPARPSMALEPYAGKLREVLALIAAGDTYQVNFTFRMRGSFEGPALALYHDLVRAQRSAYCAYLPLGPHTIVSASPELFFRWRDREVELRPMKGTRPRGRWTDEDRRLASELASSAKDRAENLMIVDLLRNDLGRVAEFGSVTVTSLFEVESYPTVHQLTSTVRGRLREEIGLVELFRALFPSGSITGAPKVRTMQIIRDLEDSPRGPYTGAIGFVSPDEAVFSVGIRTVLVDERTGRFELGVGSGVTADSTAAGEYEECLGKGAFLHHRPPTFELLESLRLESPGGYLLRPPHLDRMERSADYFDYPFDRAALERALDTYASSAPRGAHKVRLLLARDGGIRVEGTPIDTGSPETVTLRLATRPVDERSPFLYHKTTHRPALSAALDSAHRADDVVLFNRRGEVTETTTSNLVIELDGRRVTPPIESGLLAGTLRETLIERGEVEERVVTLDDLMRATAIHLVNSVRGWRAGRILPPDRRPDLVG